MRRPRDPQLVRRDALKMAVQKAQDGCATCTQRFLEIALENGSPEEEVKQAIEPQLSADAPGISRRSLLKLVAAAGASFALAPLARDPEAALAYSFYWGTDTSTERQSGAPPQNFYIGKFGGGVSQNNLFNTSAANLAGGNYTYMYWDIEGPASPNRPSGHTPYQWGVDQASAAYNAWIGDYYASYVQTVTIFGDVELGNLGYSGTQQSDNQAVLHGWLDQIKSYANGGFTNGIYISPSDWSTIYGTGYRPTRNFVLWITGCNTGSGSGNPCSQSSSTTEANVENIVNNNIGAEVFGGSQMVLWQYWIGDVGCGDYDVAVQSPYNTFYWINNATTWVCHGCGVGVCS